MQMSKQSSRDFKLTHGWLRPLIVAAQDGVIMIRAYQARVLKKDVNPMCKKDLKPSVTFLHIMKSIIGRYTRSDVIKY